jgi:RinA family phage transcriptional activator
MTARDVRRANFRLIERELYHFLATKADYEHARGDILRGTVAPHEPVQTGPSDTTANKASQLMSRAMLETERRINAIEWAMERIKSTQEAARWRLVKLKYFEGRLTNEGIMQELSIARATFYRWRDDFIRLIADRLGWEV